MVESLKIIGLGILAAIAYGIAHDNMTARVCVEYFTIGHPKLIDSTSPTILAIAWGVVATWWVGLGLGIYLALACRYGRKPKLTAGQLLKPLGYLLLTMGGVSLVAGLAGYYSAGREWVFLVGDLASRVPESKHRVFLADLWAHLAAYAGAFVGGMVLAIWATTRRDRLAKNRSSLLTDGT